MNKENAHLFLPLVQALADGKTIQYSPFDSEWSDLSDPNFQESPDQYRIKPEPREFYIYRDDLDGCFYAKESKPDLNWKEAIRVREILD